MKKIFIAIMLLSLWAGTIVVAKEMNVTENSKNGYGKNALPPTEIYENQPMEDLNMDDVKLLAAVIWAEAEGEDMYGKKLVGSVVLNRVQSPLFPDDIYSVIHQTGQFTVVGNGRFQTGYALQEPSCVQAAMEELMGRTDSNVLFFCAGGWGYGTPYMQYGNHFFSTLW